MDPIKALKDIFYLVIVIVALVLAGIGYKNYQTRQELQNTVKEQQKTIEVVDNSNKVIAGALEIKNKTDDINNSIVIETVTKKEEVTKVQEQIKSSTTKKVTEIKKKFDEKITTSTDNETTAALVTERSQEISKTRITAVWQEYCKYEQDATCKGIES